METAPLATCQDPCLWQGLGSARRCANRPGLPGLRREGVVEDQARKAVRFLGSQQGCHRGTSCGAQEGRLAQAGCFRGRTGAGETSVDIGRLARSPLHGSVEHGDHRGLVGGQRLSKLVERRDPRFAVGLRPVADDQQVSRSRSVDPVRDRAAGCPGESSLETHLASL